MVNPPFFKDHGEQREFINQMAASGPVAVRKALVAGRYKGARLHTAEVWLAQQDVDAAAARDADEVAARTTTIDLAREANDVAKASNAIAQQAVDRANTANNIATAAIIVAVMGAALSVLITFVT